MCGERQTYELCSLGPDDPPMSGWPEPPSAIPSIQTTISWIYDGNAQYHQEIVPRIGGRSLHEWEREWHMMGDRDCRSKGWVNRGSIINLHFCAKHDRLERFLWTGIYEPTAAALREQADADTAPTFVVWRLRRNTRWHLISGGCSDRWATETKDHTTIGFLFIDPFDGSELCSHCWEHMRQQYMAWKTNPERLAFLAQMEW